MASDTTNVCVTLVAASKFALPACDAVSEQVPAFTMVTLNVPAATVQIAVSFDVSVTVNDELAVGATANATPDHARSAGSVKLTVWVAFTTSIDCVADVRPGDE